MDREELRRDVEEMMRASVPIEKGRRRSSREARIAINTGANSVAADTIRIVHNHNQIVRLRLVAGGSGASRLNRSAPTCDAGLGDDAFKSRARSLMDAALQSEGAEEHPVVASREVLARMKAIEDKLGELTTTVLAALEGRSNRKPCRREQRPARH